MSATRCQVVLVLRSAPGSLACGAAARSRAGRTAPPDSVPGRTAAAPGLDAPARPAVQEDGRLAGGGAALLPVDLLAVADLQHAARVRLDRWIERTRT